MNAHNTKQYPHWETELDNAKSTSKVVGIALILTFLIAIFAAIMVIVFYPRPAQAAELVDMRIIQKIESNGNPLAVGNAGERGLYQIMPCVLKEYNQYHKVKYSWGQMFDPQKNTQVAYWYLNVRIPALLNYYKLPISTNSVIRAYNAGIRSVVKGYTPRETRIYLTKYNRMKEARRG